MHLDCAACVRSLVSMGLLAPCADHYEFPYVIYTDGECEVFFVVDEMVDMFDTFRRENHPSFIGPRTIARVVVPEQNCDAGLLAAIAQGDTA